MSERSDPNVWAEAQARHERSDNRVRPFKPTAVERVEGASTPVALSDDERNILYDAVASERASKEGV